MPREIKFRAWRKKSKEMCDVSEIDFTNSFVELWHDTTTDYTQNLLKDVELMQYTGLKDKNGKEIYEGDVVKFADWKPKVIEFGTCGFIGFGLKNTEKFLMNYDSENLEVIGNIYENPDLLK